MVMAVNGARVIARWELMREWLKGQSNQWDLAKALEQYKAVTLEEAKNKNAPLLIYGVLYILSGVALDGRWTNWNKRDRKQCNLVIFTQNSLDDCSG
ncbi:hypothetical protein F2Q70_00022091 [Brassica cretica]|uniref:Uncharacterized protein n=1 Tax=Brassica cretica TaxID=69181 RepID=A0A8S9HKV4_BRACR|nr:hypothetical protein F2Q70_00022091 [Brassica cretica]KAF2557730.1 hypothetical protein F2Q68_00015896 [Brassica cretica]